MSKFRPGDTVTFCGVTCKVASIYRGEVELTTLSGNLIDYFPARALHSAKLIERSIVRGNDELLILTTERRMNKD